MIIDNKSNPEKNLYVVGAIILQAILQKPHTDHDPIKLFKEVQLKNSYLSLAYFQYGLDWLFLTNTVKITESGKLSLCN